MVQSGKAKEGTRPEEKILTPEEVACLWEEVWKDYLKVVKTEGLEKPERFPPRVFFSTACDL